ncbi:putative bifunctional diguanylate cyclase/phosphodiesterase [Corallincola platygyrae]|uniref:Bifunctional diguanylate cyclase/phosphodiesterase n=1 Tax=Corallincola platygyrae TaxID=1193278 RepID=A0ABW4XQN4_9GAMM
MRTQLNVVTVAPATTQGWDLLLNSTDYALTRLTSEEQLDKLPSATHLVLVDQSLLSATLLQSCQNAGHQVVVITEVVEPAQQTQWLAEGVKDILVLPLSAALIKERISQLAANLDATSAGIDPLTKLPNRHQLSKHLEQQIASASGAKQSFAVMFVDLEHFKEVNDLHGHQFGDQLLRQVTEQMKHEVESPNLLCRYGGDEFAVVLAPGDSSELQARQLAIRLISLLEQPFEIEGRRISLGASVGISLYPEHGECASSLLDCADVAMFEAKSRGVGDVMLYASFMAEGASYRETLERRLPGALERQELVMYYQPVFDLLGTRVVSAEALLRWEEPEFGLIPPGDFLSVVESAGVSEALGEYILAQVCQTLKQWQDAGIQLSIAVNLSTFQLDAADFLNRIHAVVESHGVDFHQLQFEITESMLFTGTVRKLEQLSSLARAGAEIILDDFGYGLSNFSNLVKSPLSAIKIDRRFVAAATEDQSTQTLIRSLISLAHSLQKRVVAEGVETMAQRDLLLSMGCEQGQGFQFAHPMPGELFIDWFHQDSELAIATQPAQQAPPEFEEN